MTKKILNLFLFSILVISVGCNQKKSEELVTDGPVGASSAISENIEELSKETAVLKTVHGTIEFKFYNNAAPNTTKRIKELIKQGFYNGLTFHRVIKGFVAQGGDPDGNGQGGSGKNLKAEFNPIKHELGTMAMARTNDPDSADSQFYICLGAQPHLDNKYTVFAKVTKGIEAVQKLQVGDKMLSVTLSE